MPVKAGWRPARPATMQVSRTPEVRFAPNAAADARARRRDILSLARSGGTHPLHPRRPRWCPRVVPPVGPHGGAPGADCAPRFRRGSDDRPRRGAVESGTAGALGVRAWGASSRFRPSRRRRTLAQRPGPGRRVSRASGSVAGVPSWRLSQDRGRDCRPGSVGMPLATARARIRPGAIVTVPGAWARLRSASQRWLKGCCGRPATRRCSRTRRSSCCWARG